MDLILINKLFFLMLNIEKVFDYSEIGYLIALLSHMGFGEKFLKLLCQFINYQHSFE